MKKLLAVAVMALSFAPSGVLAQERAGDAALGALSGAVVLGPVGAVAGAVIGFTAGPAISHSWGTRGPEPQRHQTSPKRSTSAISNGAPAQSANGPAPAPQPAATEKVQQPAPATPEPPPTEKPVPATSLGPEVQNSMPPVQTLE
jgi:predicted lipid-binding transport protein (Tim44 family)